jgi:hypothetical protein
MTKRNKFDVKQFAPRSLTYDSTTLYLRHHNFHQLNVG